MKKCSEIFRLPSYPIYFLITVVFFIGEISKYGIFYVACKEYASNRFFVERLRLLIDKSKPYEYAFCTIVWILIIKHIYCKV